ncbi:MAG: alternative ribosome rescue aminoacyl-tRNA hydrolase ArfB [Acidobacteriota bacterium]
MHPPLEVLPGEVEIKAIRSQGPGGQNVNKVSTAVQLRFDVAASSLPDGVKARLLARPDSRLTQEGVLVITAQSHRTLEMNRREAFARLNALINSVARPPKMRRPTQPTFGSKQRRLEGKSLRSATKASRGKVTD